MGAMVLSELVVAAGDTLWDEEAKFNQSLAAKPAKGRQTMHPNSFR